MLIYYFIQSVCSTEIEEPKKIHTPTQTEKQNKGG